jgi:hypothetical protein
MGQPIGIVVAVAGTSSTGKNVAKVVVSVGP